MGKTCKTSEGHCDRLVSSRIFLGIYRRIIEVYTVTRKGRGYRILVFRSRLCVKLSKKLYHTISHTFHLVRTPSGLFILFLCYLWLSSDCDRVLNIIRRHWSFTAAARS